MGFRAPKGLGRSPYKICELDLSSLKASKNLEFLRVNLEFLEIAPSALLPRNDARNSRIPKKKPPNTQKNKGILEFPRIETRIPKKKTLGILNLLA